MSSDFYNKVAEKFGRYKTGAKHVAEYPSQSPEKVFKEKLLAVSGKDKTALDVGCADGRFTLSIASCFRKIIAIDLSEGMLKAAKKLQKEKKVKNIVFEKQDANHTLFDNESFDVVWSRRGPTPFAESYRLLKPNGFFIEIDIGERDCQWLKEMFGRGQGYGKWRDESRLSYIKQKAKSIGYKIIYTEEFTYTEYYPSYKDLDLFLQGAPIFEDFDSKKDKKLLTQYVKMHSTRKGIKLDRHRVVSVLQKAK